MQNIQQLKDLNVKVFMCSPMTNRAGKNTNYYVKDNNKIIGDL